jgi:site-specific DNA recombinase
MRVGIYVRVSTQRQAQAQTIEQQLERLQSYARDQGWVLASQALFRDDGYSGSTLKRPGLEKLRDCVAARELDLVLVTAPDRLARNYVHQVLLLEELAKYACQVEFLDRPMSQDPHDQLLLQIRGAVAEYERTLIAERMRRGRLRKLQAGLLLPWTNPPYGYRLDPERPRDPAGVRLDEAEAAVVQALYGWYLEEGMSLFGVTQKLQKAGIPTAGGRHRWNTSTVRGILTNPSYTGQVYANRRKRSTADDWIPVAPIPALVSADAFARVQARMVQNQQFAMRNNQSEEYLLRALVSCGVCGLGCNARSLNPRHRYYYCRGKLDAVQSCRDEKCLARYIPSAPLDELVWQDLCALLTDPEQLSQALQRAHAGCWLPQELQARRDGLRRGRARLRQQQERLTEAYLDSVLGLEEYGRRHRDLEQRERALAEQERQLESQVDRQTEVAILAASVEEFCQRVQEGLASATFERRRQLVELLIDRVIVTNGEVEIRYVIPTTPASERTHSCQLRSDYRKPNQRAVSALRRPA